MLSLVLALLGLAAGLFVAPRTAWKHPSSRLRSRASEPQGQLPQPKDEATHRIHSLFRLRKHLRWLPPLALFGGALVADGGFVGEKAVARLLMPPGLLWIAGYLGILALLDRGQRRVALVAGLLWGGYTLAGNLWVGGVMLRHLEAPFRADPVLDAPLDAVLLLGGGTAVRPDDGPQLGQSGDRVRVAARLWKRGQTRLLLTSGTSVAGLQQAEGRDLAQETRQLWLELGVAEDAIVMVPGPRNTREEITALKGLVAERGWRRVGLVTSAWHLPRALALAQAAELELVPFGADFRGEDPVAGLFGLVPSANGFYRVQTAAWELLGRALGR
jgi:uncharacterized SAM-binding protein YcdF (DUF218 family)